MALLDLNKIIIKRTITGIRCISCGGNLLIEKKRSVAARLIQLVSLGARRPKNYTCENCKKTYLLI